MSMLIIKLKRLISYTWLSYLLLAGFVTYEVVIRYFFLRPQPYFEEVSVLINMFASFAGIGIVTENNEQINIGMFFGKLKGKVRRFVEAIQYSLQIGVSIIAIISLCKYAIVIKEIGSHYWSKTGTPFYLMTIPVGFGMALSLLFALLKLFEILGGHSSE